MMIGTFGIGKVNEFKNSRIQEFKNSRRTESLYRAEVRIAAFMHSWGC
jgi:hypothetical protein